MKGIITLVIFGSLLPVAIGQEAAFKEVAQDSAKVVFYRERAFVGGGRRTTINIDNQKIASLVNGRYFTIMLPEGPHTFTGPDKRKGAEVTLQAQHVYYFATRLNVTGLFQVRNVWTIFPVSQEQGSFEIRSLKPLDADQVEKPFRAAWTEELTQIQKTKLAANEVNGKQGD